MNPHGIPVSVSRAFLAIDEWLGIFTTIYLAQTNSHLFYWFLIPFLVMVYGIGYPFQWWRERKAEQIRLSKIESASYDTNFN